MSTMLITLHIDEKGQGVLKEPLPLPQGDHRVAFVIRDPEEEKESYLWMIASSKVLSEIWDNEDDAIYDDYLVRDSSTSPVSEG